MKFIQNKKMMTMAAVLGLSLASSTGALAMGHAKPQEPAQPAPAPTAPAPELESMLHDNIGAVEDGMLESTNGTACTATPAAEPGAAPEEGWYFRRFWLRVRPYVTVGIPGIIKLQAVPEVELLWERQFPDGWGGYKP